MGAEEYCTPASVVFFCYSIKLYSTCISLLCPMVPNNYCATEFARAHKLSKSCNWSCVLGYSSGGFLKGFLFLKGMIEKKKVIIYLSFRLNVFGVTSTVSSQNSLLLFLEKRWLFSYLEILRRLSCPSKATEGTEDFQ